MSKILSNVRRQLAWASLFAFVFAFALAAGPAIAAPFAYVVNNGSDSVSVVDTGANAVAATISVGSVPRIAAITPNGSKVYVTNWGGNSVSVIDTGTNSVMAIVPVGLHPWGIAVSSNGNSVYVANSSVSTISVIDTGTNMVTATFGVPAGVLNIAMQPNSNYAYLTNASNPGLVSILDTSNNTLVGSIPTPLFPTQVAFNPAGTFAYVTNNGSSSVSVINTVTHAVTNVPVGQSPWGIAMHPAGTFAYVCNYGGNSSVSAINTATLAVSTIPSVPCDEVAVNPVGSRVYATGYITSPVVSIIDTATNTLLATTIPVGNGPEGIVFRPGVPRAYVAQPGNATLMALNTTNNTVAANIPLQYTSSLPWGVAVNPTGTRAYVGALRPCFGNPATCTVSVVDTATNAVIANIPVGVSPKGIAVHPKGKLLYVACSASPSGCPLYVINTSNNAVLSTIPMAAGAEGVAVHPNGAHVYVTEGATGVAVVDTVTTTVSTTSATGGTTWNVALDPAGKRLFITGNDHVIAVDTITNAIVWSATVPGSAGITTSLDGDTVFVTNGYSANTVTYLKANSGAITASVNVGSIPRFIAADPTGTFLYVTNFGSSNISVVNIASQAVVQTLPASGTAGIAFKPAGT